MVRSKFTTEREISCPVVSWKGFFGVNFDLEDCSLTFDCCAFQRKLQQKNNP